VRGHKTILQPSLHRVHRFPTAHRYEHGSAGMMFVRPCYVAVSMARGSSWLV
jgi:hypothetical protein